jgi:hypothetical protein
MKILKDRLRNSKPLHANNKRSHKECNNNLFVSKHNHKGSNKPQL